MGKLNDLAARAASRTISSGRSAGVGENDRRNPLNTMPVTGNTETDDAAEVEVVAGYLKQADEKVRKTMGPGFWCALVFTTEDQCQEFLKKTGWDRFAAKESQHIDGLSVAQQMGIELAAEEVTFRGIREDRRLVEEVGVID